MIENREHLAWAVVLLSLLLCLGLAVGTPLSIKHFIRSARVGQEVVVEPHRGTPRMQRGGRGEVIALVGLANNVPPGTVVTTGATDQGALTLYTPGEERALVTAVQIYGNTSTTLVSANSPRFNSSPLPHRVSLKVTAGRVRVSVVPAQGRTTVVELHTPHTDATLTEGSYEARVSPAVSEITVREGNAEVAYNDDEVLSLGPSQRTLVEINSPPPQVLPAERNLVENGGFDSGLEEGWEVYHRDVQQDPPGTVEVTDFSGRTAAHLHRSGRGHTEVGIFQQIDYDVRDFSLLTLHLNVFIRSQSLSGCGSVGSECPIMVRLDYKDIYGTDRVWYHGFYSADAGPNDLLPDWDEQVPFQTWYVFDSGNLVELFEEPPSVIKRLTIYASGHSFDAMVTEVELLAQE